MKTVRVEDLKGNEILGKTIISWDYQIILQEGVRMRPEYVEKLQKMGIREVLISEDEPEIGAIGILRSEVEVCARKKVKDILERHTYRSNEELTKLGKVTEKIVSAVLEDDRIVKRVFDIRQRRADIYDHSISVCVLAILTALKMKLEKDKLHDIGVGCFLHDIGLRYLTVNYENREMDTFDEEELLEYKKHPIYGYSALQNEAWISDTSKQIILSHHERLDGSGFPLKTRDISIECKIVSVCDTFDELMCSIACKKIRVHEAIEYLKMFQNSKFDKKVVDALLQFTAVYPVGTIVMTNEGEVGEIVRQNNNFQNRPVIRIIRDKSGKDPHEAIFKDLVKIQNIFIEKVVDG